MFLRQVWAAAQRLFECGELDLLNAQKLVLAFKPVEHIDQRIARLSIRHNDSRFAEEAVIRARDDLRAQQRNRLVDAAFKAIQRRVQRVQRLGGNFRRVVSVSASAAYKRLFFRQYGEGKRGQQQRGEGQKRKKLFHDESSFRSLGLFCTLVFDSYTL